jgi:hypothetical protein
MRVAPTSTQIHFGRDMDAPDEMMMFMACVALSVCRLLLFG